MSMNIKENVNKNLTITNFSLQIYTSTDVSSTTQINMIYSVYS